MYVYARAHVRTHAPTHAPAHTYRHIEVDAMIYQKFTTKNKGILQQEEIKHKCIVWPESLDHLSSLVWLKELPQQYLLTSFSFFGSG